MSGLDKRLSRLEESLSRPVYDVRKPILGGASKKKRYNTSQQYGKKN